MNGTSESRGVRIVQRSWECSICGNTYIDNRPPDKGVIPEAAFICVGRDGSEHKAIMMLPGPLYILREILS